MLKLTRYLKKSTGYVILIFIMLFVQANCDLALPGYTSDIINIGIQQSGITDAVPDTLGKESAEALLAMLDEESVSIFKSAYDLNGETYELVDISSDDRETLNKALGLAMMRVSYMASMTDEQKAAMVNMSQDEITAMNATMQEKLDQMPETIVTQSAVLYIKAEYESRGIDVGDIQTKYIIIAGLKMVGMSLLIMLMSIIVSYFSCIIAASMSRDLRKDIYVRVLSFSNKEFNSFSTASLITRSTNDVQQVQMMMMMVFKIVLYAPILGIGGVIKAIDTNADMSWIIALAVGAILILVLVLLIVAMPKFKKLQKLIDRLNLVAREILTGIPVIRAFSAQKHEEDRFEDANATLAKTNLFVNRCMTFMMPVMMLIMNGVSLLIVYVGADGINEGQMQVGDMMAFIQYAMQIIMAFLMLTMISIMMPRASVSATRISEILDTESLIKEPVNPKHVSGNVEKIEFNNVSFRYPGADENVLENITFSANKGETVAVIGSTGSGKSTLINLIPRFYDVTEGAVRINGVDIKDLPIKELNSKLGYVPQKGVLFSGTIKSNILYGCDDGNTDSNITDAIANSAADIAQATEFITEKEKGLESEISQGGTNVSGGQKQRLSIARAIARNPEIYIFDDSFSALDYKTDVQLRKALSEKTRNTITIIVAQRISTILHADKIIVLDEGKIVGIGNHKELLESCDEYIQIATSQLSKEELAHE